MSACTTEPLPSTTLNSGPGFGRSIVLVDDDALQRKLMRIHLTKAGFNVRTASGALEALEAIRTTQPDAILSDVRMDELDGFGLCSLFRSDPQLAAVPIVLVTSHCDGDDDRALAAAAGAEALIERSADFRRELNALLQVLGGAISRPRPSVGPDVRHLAQQMGRLLAQSHASAERYRALLDGANDAIAVLTPEGIILEVNHFIEETFQLSREEIVGRHIRDFSAPGHEARNVATYRNALDRGDRTMPAIPVTRADGTVAFMEWSTKAQIIGDETIVFSVGRDVTAALQAREDLAASEAKYRALIENIPDVVWVATLGGKVMYMSPNVEKVCGFSAAELERTSDQFWFDRIHPDDVEAARRAFLAISTSGYSAEYRWRHKDDRWIWIRAHAAVRSGADGTPLAEGTFSDITEQKRLEAQLRQAQKMEAIGQLTGGIAHDFNNLLAVIQGYGEFLRQGLAEDDSRRADAEAILDAGQRAAALTRQLLAFSRTQMLEPRSLDLNNIVHGIDKFLQRLIGEHIECSISLAPNLGTVRADAGQIEQVIMNLAVNARDAMEFGGKLTIETANFTFSAEDVAAHPGVRAGDYVMLAVSDTGCGMDAKTKERVFEPFFTTKEKGKGTGLGLATCYGIVKQSDGYIWIQSEPNEGSVFKVLLPRQALSADVIPAQRAEAGDVSGHETVLLIEDDKQVRSMANRALTRLGYKTLEARDGNEAMLVAGAHAGSIDLVLSDVVMPGMSGPDVVRQLRSAHGDVRALFMSGYTDHAVLRDDLLKGNAKFIQKPYTPASLGKKVRESLDAPHERTH